MLSDLDILLVSVEYLLKNETDNLFGYTTATDGNVDPFFMLLLIK